MVEVGLGELQPFLFDYVRVVFLLMVCLRIQMHDELAAQAMQWSSATFLTSLEVPVRIEYAKLGDMASVAGIVAVASVHSD